jgi:phosphomannomutase
MLLLFDIDGTLTEPRKRMSSSMAEFLSTVRQHAHIGIVGGSDFHKQQEQIGEDILIAYDYVFSENGLVAYHNGNLFHTQSLVKALGQTNLNTFTSYVLSYIANLDIPVKTGTFVELRKGMINISPVGRNCTQEQRDEFEQYDQQHHVRQTMINDLKSKFHHLGFQYSVGGQISFDVFPQGWDKTYCLQFLDDQYKEIHFFGDKTQPGGNDYEIYISPRTVGHHVTGPDDTRKKVMDILSHSMTL